MIFFWLLPDGDIQTNTPIPSGVKDEICIHIWKRVTRHPEINDTAFALHIQHNR
jgi:hypothetical protein